MEREKAAAKTKTLHWWLHWIGSPAAIFAILGGGLLYIAQAEVKPVIAKIDGEVKRLDGVDGQLQKQITEVKMSLDERLKLLHADLNAFKTQMHEDLKRLATRDDLNRLSDDVNRLRNELGSLKGDLDNVKIKIVTPQQIRTIMREVLEEYRAR